VAKYRLTIRHGSDVERDGFGGLDDAIAAMERLSEEIRGEGALPRVGALRDFEPDQRVHARLELSSGGLRGRRAGIDVMGDGALIPYSGAIRRRTLEPRDGETPFDAVREAVR
jgi:hypothetical protein